MFVHKWWHDLVSPLMLISSSGAERTVEVWNDGGKLVLGKGWEEFARSQTKFLRYDVVLFEWRDEHKLKVTFFGENGVEYVHRICRANCHTPMTFYIPYISPSSHITVVSCQLSLYSVT